MSSRTAARVGATGGRSAHHTTTTRSQTMTDPTRLLDEAEREGLADLRAYLTGRPQPNTSTSSVAVLRRVRAVLETEHVVGRTALEYRGLVLSALMTTEAQPNTDATFFQPGHTYTCPSSRATQWTFKVATVAESPQGGLAALGFLKGENHGANVWTPHGELDFNGWTDAMTGQDGAQQS